MAEGAFVHRQVLTDSALPTETGRGPLFFAGYTALLVVCVGIYLLIRQSGLDLVAPHPAVAEPVGHAAHSNTLAVVLLALAIVTVTARALGWVFERTLHQPAVIGEIVAGLLLGPSVLGWLLPDVYAYLLPNEAAPYLGLLSKVGVVLFMFLVGLDLDTAQIRRSSHATLAISHASILLPFLLGSTLSLWLYPLYGTANVSFTTFSLFAGVSLAVTAFPVLARILTDRKISRTSLGITALACAAVDDVSAWTLLALVVGVANGTLAAAALTVPVSLAYLALMFFVVRPMIGRLAASEQLREGPLAHGPLAAVFVGLLVSAWATETIGLHAMFGAFLLGALMPHDGRLAEQVRGRIQDIVVVLFLPAFFAFSGMRTEITLLDGVQDWMWCGLVIVVATVGKFGGSFVAARFVGLGWRSATAIGVLMNTRGLVELIVLNIGLDLGVISPTLFAMFVIMALVTTFATSPLLALVIGNRPEEAGAAPLPSSSPVV
jgi:Kef-type K+ transport system membrane component KefB